MVDNRIGEKQPKLMFFIHKYIQKKFDKKYR